MPISPSLVTNAEIIMMGNTGVGGSDAKNLAAVFHYKRTTNVNPISKTNLHTQFVAGPVAAILAALSVRYVQTSNTVRWIDDAMDLPTGFAQAGVGAIAGDSLPTNDAGFLLLRTAIKGRSYRGGKHLGPVAESHTDKDIFTVGALVLWNGIGTALLAPLVDSDGNTWKLQVLSRNLSQLLVNPTTVVATEVNQILVNKRIGDMRRRMVRSVY